MKKCITYQDIELICSMMVPGNYKVDIDSTSGTAQKSSGEFLADYNKPSSLVLVVDHCLDQLCTEYDYIVDLSHKIKQLDQYDKTDFKIKFNKDGSIQYLFEENSKEKFWGLNFFKNKQKSISVFHKKSIFFKKQMQHLPCDNYWVNFGGSTECRKIDVALYANNFHILNLQIAHNETSSFEISKQKYFMSKLSFFDFETLEMPNEYFSKSSKLLIKSHIISNRNKQQKKVMPFYLNEILSKTARLETIENSSFFANIYQKISSINCNNLKQKMMAFYHKINVNERLYFGLSLGKLAHTKGKAFVCYDFCNARLNAPILADFYYQFIETLVSCPIKDNNQVLQLLNRKAMDYRISDFVQVNNLSVASYFNLFFLDYVANNPTQQNIAFLDQLLVEEQYYGKAS